MLFAPSSCANARRCFKLRNVLRTMIAMCESDCLTMADFNDEWLSAGPASVAAVQNDAIALDLEGDDVLGEARDRCRVDGAGGRDLAEEAQQLAGAIAARGEGQQFGDVHL